MRLLGQSTVHSRLGEKGQACSLPDKRHSAGPLQSYGEQSHGIGKLFTERSSQTFMSTMRPGNIFARAKLTIEWFDLGRVCQEGVIGERSGLLERV